MLIELAMLGLAYGCYLLGKALWVRSVGAIWWIAPAVVVYLVAIFLVMAAVVTSGGIVLLPALAVWGGLWVGRWLARRSNQRRRSSTEDTPWKLK